MNPAWGADPILPAWQAITRLGEAQMLLPALLLTAAAVALGGKPRGALAWLVATAAATLIVTASKVAFIGYAMGYAPWDFTGISGHSMFACAVLPVLGAVLAGRWRRFGGALGLMLGVLVAGSRVQIGVHSPSEVVLGAALGFAAAACALVVMARGETARLRTPAWLPALALGWMLVTPWLAGPLATHDGVTRLALQVSGRPQPYTRGEMLMRWRLQQGVGLSIGAAHGI
jgi:membrane-associated phospholipid phosphatase